jgi:hypothetical protein
MMGSGGSTVYRAAGDTGALGFEIACMGTTDRGETAAERAI